MPPLPKILTLAGILLLLFPLSSPGKANEWPERMLISLFYGVAAWSLLGAPNWLQARVSLPKLDLPKVEQGSSFTTIPPATAQTTQVQTSIDQPATAQTARTLTTSVKPVTGVLVRCPNNLKVVNIRQAAGLTAVVAQVSCGDRVNVLGSDRPTLNGETWVPVEHNGSKGWVTGRYLAF